MQPIAKAGHGHARRAFQDVSLRSASAGDLVGPIISERRPLLEAVAETGEIDRVSSGGVDVCRLLAAVLGVGVYLAVPASLLLFGVVKLAG